MQKVSLALNIVLLILVAVLFFLFFKNKGTGDKPAGSSKPAVTLPSNVKIAYIDLDSLEDHYEYFQTKKGEFEKRASSIKSTLQMKQKELERVYTDAQAKAETMTQSEMEATQMRLQKMQQDGAQYEEAMTASMEEDQMKFNEEYQNRVESFLKKFNKDNKYTFVLSYRRIAGMVLYKDDSYDITPEVVEGLNKEYREGLQAK